MIRATFCALLLPLLSHAAAPPRPVGPAEVADAVRRGLVRARAAGTNWPKHRACFSCHNQTLPLLAVSVAGRGDAEWMEAQGGIAHEHFRKLIGAMKEGKHIGGGAFTAAYGLWALKLAGRGRDETSEAMVAYLLKVQRKGGLWDPSCVRPPSQASKTALAVLSMWLLKEHAAEKQLPAVAKASEAASKWLATAAIASSEDAAFRLWGLHLSGGTKEEKEAARKTLVGMQRDDGGWGQEKGRASDAYATGQALYVLLVTGSAADAAPVRRAAGFLVRTQHADGSWMVKTRAVPVQRDFDNGDPHGKSQFISVAATSWATAGLARLLPTAR